MWRPLFFHLSRLTIIVIMVLSFFMYSHYQNICMNVSKYQQVDFGDIVVETEKKIKSLLDFLHTTDNQTSYPETKY